MLLCVLGGTLTAGAGSWWFWHSGRLEQVVDATSARVWGETAKLGFRVENVYLEGRNFTPLADITTAMGIRHGDPILAISLSDVRARLQSVPRIKYAEIERVLPDQLHIHIIERQPIAVWQNEGKLHLIDQDGVVMEYVDPAQYKNLLLVVGEDAPGNTHALLDTLALAPEEYKNVQSAVRVGERRWNILFKNGVELKLPETGQDAAWQNFARIDQQDHILARAIKTVDMRLNDRVFIKLVPEAVPKPAKAGGKET
jgi:cell division protein FtsQ